MADISPQHPTDALNELLTKPIGELSVAELNHVKNALSRVSGGSIETAIVGELLTR